MSFIKEKTTDSGVVGDWWIPTRTIKHKIDKKYEVEYSLFVSEAAYDAGNKPLPVTQIVWTDNPTGEDMSDAELYADATISEQNEYFNDAVSDEEV